MLQQLEGTNRGETVGGSGQPSDELLEAKLQADLRGSSYHALRRVKCQLQRGVVTLRGQVPSYYHKQVAQVLARSRLGGVALVRNKLEVATDVPRG
jgi:osmotically-inducible protein OsmY